MSKVDELRKKYPNVTTVTFNKFVNGDKTNTKKYLPFMLKTWVNRNGYINTSADLVKLVNMFDELLPYIENKDIYSKNYENIKYFVEAINKAADVKEEKSFVREEHVNILEETDEYILLQPKTHKGSLIYGAQTRWCTASRNNKSTFDSYVKTGCLVYLIDKKGNKLNNFEKVAFYNRASSGILNGGFEIYHALDSHAHDVNMMNGGWSEETVKRVTFIFRSYAFEWSKISKSIRHIEKTIDVLKGLDFEFFKKNLEVVEKSTNFDYISEAKKTVDNLINNLKTIV